MPLTEHQRRAFPAVTQLITVGRGHLFERPDADLPIATTPIIAGDDLIPQIGFIGSNYAIRQILIVGINPGNGPRQERSISDAKMMPTLHAFVREPDELNYLAAMQAQMKAFPTWTASIDIWPRLQKESISLDEIAYVNANPYRAGKGEARDVFRNETRKRWAGERWLQPLVAALHPKLIIAHGVAAAEVVQYAKCGQPLVFNRIRIKAQRDAANEQFDFRLRAALAAH